MSWFSFRPYVPVAQRRRKAEAAAKKIAAKSGRALAPVNLPGRTIAATFWGKAWCDNLESYSDFANRLPRGRTYVRNGSVIDLQITQGRVTALVQGSELYKIAIKFTPLPAKRWTEFKTRNAGKIINLLDLLQGRLSKEILADITARETGLFPSPREIDLDCSCPDWADMCKHVAAALNGVGARLDEKPELLFTLRGVDMQELVAAASLAATTSTVGTPALDGASLTEIFGVEIETGPAPASTPGVVSLSGDASSRTRAKRASTRKKQVKRKKMPATRKTRRSTVRAAQDGKAAAAAPARKAKK